MEDSKQMITAQGVGDLIASPLMIHEKANGIVGIFISLLSRRAWLKYDHQMDSFDLALLSRLFTAKLV